MAFNTYAVTQSLSDCPPNIKVIWEVVHIGMRNIGGIMLDLTAPGDTRATWQTAPTVVVWQVSNCPFLKSQLIILARIPNMQNKLIMHTTNFFCHCTVCPVLHLQPLLLGIFSKKNSIDQSRWNIWSRTVWTIWNQPEENVLAIVNRNCNLAILL